MAVSITAVAAWRSCDSNPRPVDDAQRKMLPDRRFVPWATGSHALGGDSARRVYVRKVFSVQRLIKGSPRGFDNFFLFIIAHDTNEYIIRQNTL